MRSTTASVLCTSTKLRPVSRIKSMRKRSPTLLRIATTPNNALTCFAEGEIDPKLPCQGMMALFERHYTVIPQPRWTSPDYDVAVSYLDAPRFVGALHSAEQKYRRNTERD